jgi:hypothetical protein
MEQIVKEINLNEYKMVDIDSIEEYETIDMNDIQVEDNETFFIFDNGNKILTHNSAIASFTEIRNPAKQAGMPLRGKVLNVYNKAPIDAMENNEVADIVTAIGLEFNEQQGDWIVPKHSKIFNVEFESLFEVDKEGNNIVKNVYVIGDDRFVIDKKWIKVEDLYKEQNFSNYILKIEEIADTENVELTQPDYFHFRRLWDYRGFRRKGVPYKVKIGREELIVNDIDEIMIDGDWHKVSTLLKRKKFNFKQNFEIEKAPINSELTMYHKWLKPSFDCKLNYNKVFISTDADPDGSAINNLLVNLLHEYFPELFWNKENPFVYRIIFPMISATKGRVVKYYSNRPEFDKAKEKKEIDDTFKITYFKGLGSMVKKDWEHVFKNLNKYSFAIYDDGYLDELMKIFFDEHAIIRKEWLAVKI